MFNRASVIVIQKFRVTGAVDVRKSLYFQRIGPGNCAYSWQVGLPDIADRGP